jgi:anaerobic selenocysteine-containing dehydrogenase
VLLELARRVRPELQDRLSYADTAALRREIAAVVPLYQGIETLAKKGDQVQYGGPHLCAGWRFGTPSGKARFGVVPLPADLVPPGAFRVATRRGKQFNSMVHAEVDRLNGARRDHILMSQADAERLGLVDDTPIILESAHGRYAGRVKIAPVAIGSLQVHWPEGNVLLDPRRRSRVSGIPDYNTIATVSRAS